MSVEVSIVIERIMECTCDKNCEVEDLVTCTAEVKFAWGTAFRHTKDVDDGALDVDVATKGPKPETSLYNS